MNKIVAALAFSIATSFAVSVHAEDFPDWSLREVCSSGDDTCPRFEQRARGEISGVWSTLPPLAREGCVAETKAVGKSYRLLSSCLANAMQQLLTNQQRHSEER